MGKKIVRQLEYVDGNIARLGDANALEEGVLTEKDPLEYNGMKKLLGWLEGSGVGAGAEFIQGLVDNKNISALDAIDRAANLVDKSFTVFMESDFPKDYVEMYMKPIVEAVDDESRLAAAKTLIQALVEEGY